MKFRITQEMKKQIKSAIALIVLILIFVAAGHQFIRAAYHEMGGLVLVTSKEEAHGDYYITIKRRDPFMGRSGASYRLKCTKEQYDMVSIGDTADISRNENKITGKGEVYNIYEIVATDWVDVF